MKPTILVVDDEWSMRELLRNVLELSGFQPILAANEEEFRELIKTRPDAVILDIILGEKDGTQIYADLLHDGLDPTIPVIFLSALAKDRPPIFPRKDRRYALVGKPFDPEELVRELRNIFVS